MNVVIVDRRGKSPSDYDAPLPFDWKHVLDRLDERLPSEPARGA
ncbi:hypothetical protein [Burkholderia sp. Bp9031]|nr:MULTISPECIES: hypothetical protein [Burkholderia]